VILSLTYSRICGYFIPLQDAETLVRSHMATAVGVTDNGQIQSTYFPEPSLAAGSQYVCDELGGYGSADMVKQLSKIIRSNPSNPGDVGEVATCMILLKVMDKLHRPVRDDPSEESSPKFPIVSVSQFLDTLLGESYNDIEQFKKVFNDLGGKIDWDNLVISFNHFFRAEFPEGDRGPEWELRLRSAYDRCGAIIADKNYKGIDLIIPAVSKKDPKKITAILVQVKNTERPIGTLKTFVGPSVIGFSKKKVFPGVVLIIRTVKGKQETKLEVGTVGKKDDDTEEKAVGVKFPNLDSLRGCLSENEINAYEDLCSGLRESCLAKIRFDDVKREGETEWMTEP